MTIHARTLAPARARLSADQLSKTQSKSKGKSKGKSKSKMMFYQQPAQKRKAFLRVFMKSSTTQNYAPLVLASERRKIIAHVVSRGIREMDEGAPEGRKIRRNNLSPMQILSIVPGLVSWMPLPLLSSASPRLPREAEDA